MEILNKTLESDVIFDDDISIPVRPDFAKKAHDGLLDLVQKWGLAKDETSAGNFLLGVFVVVVILAIVSYVLFLMPRKAPKAPPIPASVGVPRNFQANP